MAEQTFFYLPDISGFTSFVKDVEVSHSQHIISELLELIIDSNELGLTVAEIEGDAVFFFKSGKSPTAKEILDQTRKTYVKFHEHLKLYDSHRICNCGACSSASGLSLKFVAHEGEASMIEVKGNKKPFGEEVIAAHRLLKNNVEGNEYVLFTKGMIRGEELNAEDIEWKPVVEGESEYGDLGTIKYGSIGLESLRKLVMNPPPLEELERGEAVLEDSIIIDENKEDVFELISNLEYRSKWNKGVDEFKFKEGQVNRVGTVHTCVIGKRLVEQETITSDFGENKLVIGERTRDVPLISENIAYFIAEDHEDKTKVTLELFLKSSPFKIWIFKKLLRGKLQSTLTESLMNLKSFAESELKAEKKAQFEL